MPSKPLPISPAISHLLRERREALGLTLRRVEELSAETGSAIPHSTLARIELGEFDPGVRRLGQLLNLYQLPIQAAGDVLDVEALAGILPMERDPAKLRDRALDAWRHGRVSEALSYFLAFRKRVPNDDAHRVMRQEAILAFAVASGSLGKLHLSRQMLDEMLLENPEPAILVPILIQLSVIWRSLGSHVMATTFVDAAAKHARDDAPKQQGWVEHERAQLLMDERKFSAAAKCADRAIQLHRRAKSRHDEAKVLLFVTRLHSEEGKPEAALAAARRSEQFAVKHGLNRVRLASLADQARALIALGDFESGKKLLRSVLADSLAADDNVLCFYAHFYLWQAESGSGNAGRAAMELQEARYYVKFVDQNAKESRLLREAPAEPQRKAGRIARTEARASRAPRKARTRAAKA